MPAVDMDFIQWPDKAGPVLDSALTANEGALWKDAGRLGRSSVPQMDTYFPGLDDVIALAFAEEGVLFVEMRFCVGKSSFGQSRIKRANSGRDGVL
jgi:hypothetical protein